MEKNYICDQSNFYFYITLFFMFSVNELIKNIYFIFFIYDYFDYVSNHDLQNKKIIIIILKMLNREIK